MWEEVIEDARKAGWWAADRWYKGESDEREPPVTMGSLEREAWTAGWIEREGLEDGEE